MKTAEQRIPAFPVAADVFFNFRRGEIAMLAAQRGVPAMYSLRDYTVAGGLLSYGVDLYQGTNLVV